MNVKGATSGPALEEGRYPSFSVRQQWASVELRSIELRRQVESTISESGAGARDERGIEVQELDGGLTCFQRGEEPGLFRLTGSAHAHHVAERVAGDNRDAVHVAHHPIA